MVGKHNDNLINDGKGALFTTLKFKLFRCHLLVINLCFFIIMNKIVVLRKKAIETL